MLTKNQQPANFKFVILHESEYEKFWQQYPERCFLSSPKIRLLTANAQIYFLGVRQNGALVAAAMIRGIKRKFNFYDYFAPYGVLMDYHNKELLYFFIDNIKSFLRHHHGYIFRMNPNIELVERDINGKIVPGGHNNYPVVENLVSYGFIKRPYIPDLSQISWQFVLPLAGKTSDEILSSMRQSTRRCIRKALNSDIKIRELSFDEIDKFYNLLTKTATRKKFIHRDLQYFKKMFKIFTPTGEIQFVVATIRSKTHPSKEIIVSGGMFMLVGTELVYVFGGNDKKYLGTGAAYALQWEMIQRALAGGFARYNFYGICDDIEHHQDDGVYQFKKGFSGHVEELIGEYELPVSPVPFYINKGIRKIRSVLGKK